MNKKFFAELKALLKKDISILFRKKIAIFIFGGPFLILFLMLGLPLLFGAPEPMVITIYNEDQGYENYNIGDNILANLTVYLKDSRNYVLNIVDNYETVLNSKELGIYIAANFSYLTLNQSYPLLFVLDKSNNFLSAQAKNEIFVITKNVITTTLANRTIPPIYTQTISLPTTDDSIVFGPAASTLAFPFGYMILLLVSLNASANSLIGFAREKRMRTMETLLAYTKNHSALVISKVITGFIASLGSSLSYVLAVVLFISASDDSELGFASLFAIVNDYITTWDIVLIFIAAAAALIIATMLTMAIDCHVTREASERISPLVSIGLVFFFYFAIISSPFTFLPSLMINPFYWCYRFGLLAVNGIFTTELLLYPILIISLLSFLVLIAIKGIRKEQTLYLD